MSRKKNEKVIWMSSAFLVCFDIWYSSGEVRTASYQVVGYSDEKTFVGAPRRFTSSCLGYEPGWTVVTSNFSFVLFVRKATCFAVENRRMTSEDMWWKPAHEGFISSDQRHPFPGSLRRPAIPATAVMVSCR